MTFTPPPFKQAIVKPPERDGDGPWLTIALVSAAIAIVAQIASLVLRLVAR